MTGVLLASAEDVERLVAGGSAELEAAGAVVAGRPHPALRLALAAIKVPRHWRVVDRATATAVEVVIAGAGAWLVVPDGAAVELRPASGAEVLHQLQND